MSVINITIIGLGRIGASLGLALKRYNARKDAEHQFKITGFEQNSQTLGDARRLSAADEYAANLPNAVRERDIVVIATQMQETEAVYEMIGADLRSGAVVLDFSPLKRPALQWAAKHVGAEVYVIGVTPAINPKYLFDAVDDTDHAHDDLFEKGSLLLAPAPNCIKEAVELAMDFAALLDASFTFTDPVELDGLTAAMESVPAVLGVMAYHALSRTDGWQDGQRVTNSAFGALTHHLFDTHPDHLRDTLMHNRESVLRYLDVVIEGLGDFRRELARGDHDAVEAALVEAAQTYEVWYNRRLKGDWQGKQQNPMEGVSAMGQMVSGLFGSYLTGRLKGGKDKR